MTITDQSATQGYWGPPSSTIDWCQSNYTRSIFMAEYWNAFSASVVALFSLYLLRVAYAVRAPQTIFMAIVALWMTGMGSFGFHSTLLSSTQVFDELPVLLLTFTGIYSVLIRIFKCAGLQRLCLLISLIITGLTFAVFHIIYSFTLATIILDFALGIFFVVCLYILILKITRHKEDLRQSLTRQFYFCQTIFMLAGVCWSIDYHLCDQLNSFLDWTPELHALYHFLMGLYAYSSLFIHLNCTFIQTYNVNIILFSTPLKWIPMASRQQLEKAKALIMKNLEEKQKTKGKGKDEQKKGDIQKIKEEQEEQVAQNPIALITQEEYQWTLDPWSKFISYQTAFSNYPKMFQFLTYLQVLFFIVFTLLLIF